MELRPDIPPPADGPPQPSASVAARILEAIPDGILAFDRECRYTAWNPGMERISGMPAAEVLGRVAWEVFPFLADEGEDAFFRAALAGEERTVGDRRFRIPETGREGFFQARYAPLRDASGAVVGGMALIRDVTESRAADQALRMQARVLESMSEGVSVSDEEGVILYTNPAEDRMFGYGPGELAGANVTAQNAYPPGENRRIVDEVIAHLRDHGAWTGEWRNRRKDGSEFFTLSRITALEMAGRRYWVCVQEDVTERKRARAELEAARDQAELQAAALRESERRFRSFVEASAQIVWNAEPTGEMAHVEGWSALTGQSADDMALAGWLEALHPDDRAPTREAWMRAVRETSLYEQRFRVRVRSGAYRWHLSRAAPVLGDDGRVREWVGTIADVDDHVRAEERRTFLAEASRLLGASLELDETLAAVTRFCVPFLADYSSVDLLGADGRIRRVASAHVDAAKEAVLREMWERWPYDPAERTGAPVAIRTGEPLFMPRVDDDAVAAFARDAEHLALLRALGARSYLCFPLAARGSVFGALSLVFSDSGRRYGEEDAAVARELAERASVAIEHARLFAEAGAARVRAEIAEAELSRVFAQAPVAICVVRGPEHVFELANPHYRALLGDREPVGRPVREVLPELEGQGVFEILDRVYQTGEPFTADAFRLDYDRRGDGAMETAYFNFVYHPLRDPAGVVNGLVAIATEVTEQVRGRQEAVRLQAEAEEANRAKSLFLATMSHEIRTPINAIVGYADLMELGLAGPLTDLQRAQISRVKSSSRHLLGLVNDVLDLAKVESGEMVVAREEADLADAAEEALALVAPQSAAAALALEDGCRGAGLRFIGDPDRVRQVLVNLLSNAVKFTPAGGRITLGCAAVEPGGAGAPAGDGAWTCVWVEDTGIGIAPELQSTVFEPFVQAESGHTRRAGGTGLGLTISRRLARLMGGDLTVHSIPGKGSRFTLWLPAAAE